MGNLRLHEVLCLGDMKMVRAYSKSEDAYIAASILGSSGIEAVVIDENSIGGNLLGTQKAAIRVEVEEPRLEEAKELLRAAEARAEENRAEVFETVSVLPRRSRLFDILVLAELGTVFTFHFFPSLFFPEVDPEFQGALWEMHLFSREIHENALMFGALLKKGYLFLALLASALLLLRIRLGRILFTAVTVYSLLLNLFYSAGVVSSFGSFFTALSWILTGAVLLYCWSPATRGEFQKRAG